MGMKFKELFASSQIKDIMLRENDLQISKDAIEKMKEIAGEWATQKGLEIKESAIKEGRKTIMEKDIEKAMEELQELQKMFSYDQRISKSHIKAILHQTELRVNQEAIKIFQKYLE